MRVLNSFAAPHGNKICFVLGGVHGNEPAGVLAWQRFAKNFETLNQPDALNGMIIGVLGNSEAYKKRVRYVDTDMNRLFSAENIASLLIKKENLSVEEHAAKELIKLFRATLALRTLAIERQCELILLDIHTTSAPSAPFCAVGQNFNSFFWTDALDAYVIHGLEKALGGNSTIAYFNEQNLRVKTHALTLEVGQHTDALSVDIAYESILKTLVAFDMISETTAQLLNESDITPKKNISAEKNKVPHALDVLFRFALQPTDTFEMQVGFRSFDRVTTQTLLAYCNGAPVYPPFDAYLLMPLYQAQGSDGFFLVDERHVSKQ